MNHTRRPPSSDLHAPMMVLDFAADAMPGQRLLFTHAHTVELAWQANEVLPALQRIEHAVQQGAWAVGYIAYEAAAGLDPALARAMRPPHPPIPQQPATPPAPATPTSATREPATPLLAFALFTGPDTGATCHNSALPYAGGTDLLVKRRAGLIDPPALVHLGRIPALRAIRVEGEAA